MNMLFLYVLYSCNNLDAINLISWNVLIDYIHYMCFFISTLREVHATCLKIKFHLQSPNTLAAGRKCVEIASK